MPQQVVEDRGFGTDLMLGGDGWWWQVVVVMVVAVVVVVGHQLKDH